MARVATADGYELHAEAQGDGPRVIFSCALNTTSENWRPQQEALVDAGYRVVLWDFRGHGRSDVPPEAGAYSIDRVVDDLGRVLDWAGEPGGPAVLAGLSFGGLASQHFALRHPERVRGLVLAGSGPGFKKPEAQAGWQKAVERTAGFLESQGAEAFVERAAPMAVGRRPELPAAQKARAAIAAQDPKGLALFARNIAGPAPATLDRLAEIQAPTLVLVGEEDKDYLRAADVMEARIPRAEKVVIAGAGHIANIEEAVAFNDALLRFLGGL